MAAKYYKVRRMPNAHSKRSYTHSVAIISNLPHFGFSLLQKAHSKRVRERSHPFWQISSTIIQMTFYNVLWFKISDCFICKVNT